MKKIKKLIAVISNQEEFFRKIRYSLEESCEILEKKSIKSLEHLLRIKTIQCILLSMEEPITESLYLYKIKKDFPLIPLVAVTNHDNLELARACGAIGIDKVIPSSKLENIAQEITRLCSEKTFHISLRDLNICLEKQNYSELLKNALDILEKHYISLTSVTDIAAMIDVSECTLSREFQKHQLLGPKRILMSLKVCHASLLMKNKGLNNREIAFQSGFSSDKRMAECFQRVLNLTPGEFRDKRKKNTTDFEPLSLAI
jgi:AraC-like DNA-binding protein